MENARALLRGYITSRNRIATLSAELASMSFSLNNVHAVSEKIETRSLSSASDATARIVEMLGQEINEAADRCDLAIEAISSLGDTEEREVLELYYISGLTLREIATEKLYRCLTTVKNLHRRGLMRVEDYLTKRNSNGGNENGEQQNEQRE